MIIFMYVLFGLFILLALMSIIGAIVSHDIIMVVIAVLLIAAALLMFLEIRKTSNNPFG